MVNISADKYKIAFCQCKKKDKACACLRALHLGFLLLKQFPLGLQFACSLSSGFYSSVTSLERSFLATLSQTVSPPTPLLSILSLLFVYYAKCLSHFGLMLLILLQDYCLSEFVIVSSVYNCGRYIFYSYINK